MKSLIASIGLLGGLAVGTPGIVSAAPAQESTAPQVEYYCRNLPNSTGQVSAIDVLGSLSISRNDTWLYSLGCPPDTWGLFLMSESMNWRPFGNGFLCVGKPIYRLGDAGLTDSKGRSRVFLDLLTFPEPGTHVVPGSTWYFQCYFRDTAAGGAGFNLSSAAAALFTQ